MLLTAEFAAFVFVSVIGFLIWRWLVRSSWFNHFVSGTKPTPITEDEALESLDESDFVARRCLSDAEASINKKQQAAERLRKRI